MEWKIRTKANETFYQANEAVLSERNGENRVRVSTSRGKGRTGCDLRDLLLLHEYDVPCVGARLAGC